MVDVLELHVVARLEVGHRDGLLLRQFLGLARGAVGLDGAQHQHVGVAGDLHLAELVDGVLVLHADDVVRERQPRAGGEHARDGAVEDDHRRRVPPGLVVIALVGGDHLAPVDAEGVHDARAAPALGVAQRHERAMQLLALGRLAEAFLDHLARARRLPEREQAIGQLAAVVRGARITRRQFAQFLDGVGIVARLRQRLAQARAPRLARRIEREQAAIFGDGALQVAGRAQKIGQFVGAAAAHARLLRQH